MKEIAKKYRDELFNNVLPFWMNHSLDQQDGGFFTCLDRNGNVYDTDKFIWLQARQIWTFAMLFKEESKPDDQWLSIARHGADFLSKYGRDENGQWYFSLRRDGKPLVRAYNIFSDCFACMGFGKLFQVTQEEKYAAIALEAFNNIQSRKNNPKGIYNKQIAENRPLKNFALPMIICNLAMEIEPLLDRNTVETTIEECLHEVMDIFYDEKTGIILENVTPEGKFDDSFDGRLMNPGHAIEAMWFVMDLGQRLGKPELIREAAERGLTMLEKGWDDTHQGIFYFLDAKGYPTQQLEWDQKLWWVHLETLVSLSKSINLLGDRKFIDWFKKVHNYTWHHFADPGYGEWWGYLNRKGEVLKNLKGGKWKGCFHVPRALYQCSQLLNIPDIHN
jgi:N-acylglucosamine 2-epimerase